MYLIFCDVKVIMKKASYIIWKFKKKLNTEYTALRYVFGIFNVIANLLNLSYYIGHDLQKAIHFVSLELLLDFKCKNKS